MNYLIDGYSAYFADGGILGKVGEGINWLFVELPFFVLRLGAIFMLIIQELLDQSELFSSKQQGAYDISLTVLNNMGGKSIARGSLLAVLLIVSAYYLLYKFFVSRKNFSKVILHYVAIFMLFVFWFGSIPTSNGTKSGGLFLVETTSNVMKDIKNNFTSGSTDFTTSKSDQLLDETPLFNATIMQTFYYVNTGSLDGVMENDEKIDTKKLLMPSGLDKSKKKEFEKERKEYIKSIKDDNPYVVQDMSKTIEKTLAIFVGGVNLMVTSYPALYVNAMLSVIQLIITMLIIIAPVFFVMSFIPACQSMLFKFFKLLIGILFFPVILGVFLAVFFWANKMIDTVYLAGMKLVSQPILTLMSGGIFLLASNLILVVVKIFLYKSIWKNKYRLLDYFTDNQIQQPEILEKVDEKTQEAKDRAKDVTVGGAEMALGAYTGNQMLVSDGANRMMPKVDRAMNMGRYDYSDEDHKPRTDLDDWVDSQEEERSYTPVDEQSDVEFVDIEPTDYLDVPMDEMELDNSLEFDSEGNLYDDISPELFEPADTVSVDNLDEITLETEDEKLDRILLEETEKGDMSIRSEFELDKEFPEDIFFRDEVMSDKQDEGW